MMIDKKIVKAARHAIESYFSKEDFSLKDYNEKRGIFVTLYENGELRGCIGFIEPVELNKGIIDAARSAAFSDPRFPSVSKSELKEIKIEVSILTVPELVRDIKEIKIGRDGLIIEEGWSKGLLLPQVFPEWNVKSVEDALGMTCEKAGLSKDRWKDKKNVKIYKFQTEIFKENE